MWFTFSYNHTKLGLVISPRVGTPIYKGHRCSSEILKRTSNRYQYPVLWAWLKIRGTNSNATHYLLSYLFRINTPKGTGKTPARVPFEA